MTGDPRCERVPLSQGWSLWPVAAVRSAGMPFASLRSLARAELLADPPGEKRNAAIRESSSLAIAALLQDETILEALTWQNPNAIRTWIGDYVARLAGGSHARLSNRAYRETVIARYAQRYCAKNESIGFFGPVAWARLDTQAQGIKHGGRGGIRRRSAYLETWAIAALAEAWRQDARLFPYLPVRLDPATSFRDGVLWRPRRPPTVCEPADLAVLTAIDGHRRCGQVLAAAASTGAGPAPSQRELRATLSQLHESGVVRIGFRIPHHERPELYLRAQLAELPEGELKYDLLQRLDEIIEARDAAASAHGPRVTRVALEQLADRFAKAGCPGAAVARTGGYGRTPAYLDCRRDTDVRIGGDLLTELRAPLGVLLGSARWLTTEIASAVSDGLLERYRWLRSRREVVSLSDLQFVSADLLSPAGVPAKTVLEDFQLRWAEILPANGAAEIRLTSAEVLPLAGALFPASTLRWAASRQHSPDLMLCQDSNGSAQWVLGELHVALNTLESRLFRTQCDAPGELVALTASDMRNGRVVPLYPLDAAEATARTYPPPSLDPPGLYRYWSYGPDEGHYSGAEAVAGTEITIYERDGDLVGEAETRGWAAPVLEFFGEFLTAIAVNLFQIRERRGHGARVLLDNVVICRESWSVPVTTVPVPAPGRKIADRGHQQLREWAAGLGMPRHVFVRTPLDKKPFYVDFCAPLLIGNLVRAIRRALAENSAAGDVPIDFMEMMPGPEALWLTDSTGRTYTSEFRAVAVDSREVGPVVTSLPAEGTSRAGSRRDMAAPFRPGPEPGKVR